MDGWDAWDVPLAVAASTDGGREGSGRELAAARFVLTAATYATLCLHATAVEGGLGARRSLRGRASATAVSECAQLLEKSVGLPPSPTPRRGGRRRAKESPGSRGKGSVPLYQPKPNQSKIRDRSRDLLGRS